MRIRDYGITVGSLPAGPLNRISDVEGVTVGHATVINEKHQTGVTVIMPCGDDPFTRKLTAACFVLNGFGKSTGLVQIDELGTIETPIVLTNTLNVGKMQEALVGYMVERGQAEGIDVHSVNPVVCECNDARLNLITERAVEREDLLKAIGTACKEFQEGAVGGGRGMGCHGLKGGIGSSSRQLTFDGRTFTVGILVMTNHGSLQDLVINGDPIGQRIMKVQSIPNQPDKGSCIVVMATDLPLSDRQIRRVLKRCPVGMARLGSFIGQGSGEIFVGFSTANRQDSADTAAISRIEAFRDNALDPVFRAAAESTEEAILNAMCEAEAVTGYSGYTRHALSEYLGRI